MKQEIRAAIEKAIEKLYPQHKDIVFAVDYAPPNVGADYSSNAAMILATKLAEKPDKVAEQLVGELKKLKPIVAKPGFLNFKFPENYWQGYLQEILSQGEAFGSSDAGRGTKINLESVSANPTGPLTVGHGRGAMIGLVLGNVLKTQGYDVTRDYYYNNGGLQMKKLGESVKLRVEEDLGSKIVFPEDLYQGEYIKVIAGSYIEEHSLKEAHNDLDKYATFAAAKILTQIKGVLGALTLDFDNYFKESSLINEKEKGNIWEILKRLEEAGVLYKKDGAVWLKLNGGDNDKVLVRSTGEPTYRLPDIAYHAYKLDQGYDLVINVLGADHVGQFPDIQFALGKLGYDPEMVQVILHQFITLAGKKMSTRIANYVTLDELIREVGADVVKFFMSMVAAKTHMNFDLALAKNTSDKNPVYKVQYAHARINSIMKKAKFLLPDVKDIDLTLLRENEELDLIKELSKYPEILHNIRESYAVHHVPHYLLGLADKLHSFYEKIRVISDDDDLTKARMALMRGVQIVLANGLGLLGIEALDKM